MDTCTYILGVLHAKEGGQKLTSSIHLVADRFHARAVRVQVRWVRTGALDVLGVTLASLEGGGGTVVLEES